MSDQFIGEIRSFGFSFAPRDWAYCDGQLLEVAQNTTLYALLGTRFGGNGRTNFGVPNLQGRATLHAGNGIGLTPRPLAQMGGNAGITLTEAQTPSHNHGMNVDNEAANESNNPAGRFISSSENTMDDIFIPVNRVESEPPLMYQGFVQYTGGDPHENRQPFLVTNFCIALDGVFPTRS